VIESGPEKDPKGKMSGTFHAGKSALEMGRPLFVLSPQCFEHAPAGNAELIRLGGIEIDLKNGVDQIVQRLGNRSDGLCRRVVSDNQSAQLHLFDGPEGGG